MGVGEKQLRWMLALALAVLSFACSRSQLERLDANAVVLAFGDSVTLGTGADPSESYPAILERSIGRKVVNGGVPGENTAQGLGRLPSMLQETQPKLVILCHGINDFIANTDNAKTAGNIREMIRLMRGKGIPVVLVAMPKPGPSPAVLPFYGEIATEFQIPMEGEVMKSVMLDKNLRSDSFHPNARGYAKVAAAVQEVLKKGGAI
jgi:lysophospholipase L1-like esterase